MTAWGPMDVRVMRYSGRALIFLYAASTRCDGDTWYSFTLPDGNHDSDCLFGVAVACSSEQRMSLSAVSYSFSILSFVCDVGPDQLTQF